jgi:hypothetical protein
MRPKQGRTEGPGPDQALIKLFHDFEELCEVEGPGAADEGDLCGLRQRMTEACMANDAMTFLDLLAEAMLRRDGSKFDDPETYAT